MNNAPIPPALADALREPDPVRRFEAARTAGAIAAKAAAAKASEEAKAPYEAAATEALEEVVAAHGGNVRAAARELPISEQAVHKRRAKTGHGKRRAPAPKAPATQQVQPALAFDSVGGAEDALLDWALRRQEVDDQRDALLLGALAAG
ncbi:hypothetical protein, partial [Streptomyces tsukubensis]|uniref:hypothetical protein n=1 Tax=Streptomyces tsukubensis TaxID=83656 RepID=UPI00344F275B